MSKKSLLHRLFGGGPVEPEPALEAAGDPGAVTTEDVTSEETDEAVVDNRIERVAEGVTENEVMVDETVEIETKPGENRLPPEPEVETRTPVIATRGRAKKEEMALKLTEGFDNLGKLLKNVNENLEASGERAERMAQELEGLPEVLKQIPETNRAQVEFLGAISRQLDVQNSRNAELSENLSSLPELLKIIPEGHQTHAEKLGMIADQIATNSRSQLQQFQAVQKAQDATFVALRNSQNKSINLVNKAQQSALTVFKQAQASQARQVQTLIDKTQKNLHRTLLYAAGIMGAAIVGAVVLTLILGS